MKFTIAVLILGFCYYGAHGKPTCECPHRYGVGQLNALYRRQRASLEADRQFCHDISARSEESGGSTSRLGSLSNSGPRQRKDQTEHYPGVRKTDSSQPEYVDLDNTYLPFNDVEYQG